MCLLTYKYITSSCMNNQGGEMQSATIENVVKIWHWVEILCMKNNSFISAKHTFPMLLLQRKKLQQRINRSAMIRQGEHTSKNIWLVYRQQTNQQQFKSWLIILAIYHVEIPAAWVWQSAVDLGYDLFHCKLNIFGFLDCMSHLISKVKTPLWAVRVILGQTINTILDRLIDNDCNH